MLYVFICEDFEPERKWIEKYVLESIMIENYDMEIAVSAGRPEPIIEYLKTNDVTGLYFLDIDLKTDIDGIDLAEKIRKYDPRGFIAFITGIDNALPVTIRRRVEAVDFIVKSYDIDIQQEIHACIRDVYEKYTSKRITETYPVFTYKVGNDFHSIEYLHILYFYTETGLRNRVIVQHTYGSTMFSGSLKEVEKSVGERFFRCHGSYIINLDYVKKYIGGKGKVYLKGDIEIPVSLQKRGALKQILLRN